MPPRFCLPAALACALLAGAAPAFAQIETVVVTASPPDPVGNAAFSVVHLDAAQLRKNERLDESLEQVPGLSLFRRNSSLTANPTTQGVSLRSIAPSGAGRALVTLDGVPQNDPFGNWVIWSSLPPEDIASAEVVRGAGAGPYGAGALTGVIALNEQQGDGLAAGDAEVGTLDSSRVAAAGGGKIGKVGLFASASIMSSGGYIPVNVLQRGEADDDLTLDARNISLRADYEISPSMLLAARVGAYDEKRDSGVVDTASEASGETASLTLVHAQSANDLGWRIQGWMRNSNLANSSASIGPGRNTAAPSDQQYATPAIGWGANAALRGALSWLDWEVGGDVRLANGDAKDHSLLVDGAFTQNRVAGGQTVVGGAYVEGASHQGPWLLTAGLRADEWASMSGHLIQGAIDGSDTTETDFSSRSGTLPTARFGVRREIADWLYLRSAAYEGFRAPSLNELYRPFRLGNNVTEANPALAPEQLYGAEVGAGGSWHAFSWDATLFFNQLHHAITNVTVGEGPGNFPGAGFVPAGGLLIQRQNAGDINAPGVEADAHYAVSANLDLNAAFDFADAHVDGGTQAPQLTGKRPSQAPRYTVTAGFIAYPLEKLTLSADMRFESARFADDQNTLRLAPATTVDARIAWQIAGPLSAYLAADNLFNAAVATTESADGTVDYAAPRIIRFGLTYTQ